MADNTPTTYPFSDPLMAVNFASPDQKKDKEFGRKLLERIYREQNNNNSTMFYLGRTARWKENWNWAMGRQPMQEFLDYTSVSDATKSLTNVDLTQDRTGPQFVETLVSSMAQNEEYPCVTAIDDGSVKEKNDEKEEALFRMYNTEMIAQAQEATGMVLEPPDAYVPDDELSAEVHFKLEARLPKEIEFEEYLEKVMRDNEYDILKRRIYRDLIVVNCCATKIEKEHGYFVSIRKCISSNLIYNFFLSDTGKMELSYIGEVYSLKIRDLRKKYGKSEANPNGLTEKEIFEISKNATKGNVANRWNYLWREDYLWLTDRPYDDFNITVFDCEVQCYDTDYYVSKTDNYGKENIRPKNGIPQPQSDRAKIITTGKTRWYRGVWAVQADKMIYWGLPDVVITPYMDITTSLSSYTINIPNNDGDYVPSLFERALEPLRRYQLAIVRLKQLMANMAPAGYTLDVEGARDIDLGNGNVLSWIDVIKVRNQTGVVVWSSRGLNPNEVNQGPPIQGLPNAESVAQLQEISAIMTQCQQQIRSLLGVPLYRDGSDLGERTAAKLAEGQNVASYNVTDFIARGYIQLIQETLYKCCLLRWDELILNDSRMDLKDTIFNVYVEMKPTLYEKQQIEKMIDVAMANQLISFVDAFKIRQIKNYKLAGWYLSQVTEKNKREAAQASAENQKANIEDQRQSLMMKAQADQQIVAVKLEGETLLEQTRSKNKMQETLLEKGMELYIKLLTAPPPTEGQKQPQIPFALDEAISIALQNAGLITAKTTADTQKQIQQEAQQEQMEQQMVMQQQMQQQQMMENEAAQAQLEQEVTM